MAIRVYIITIIRFLSQTQSEKYILGDGGFPIPYTLAQVQVAEIVIDK